MYRVPPMTSATMTMKYFDAWKDDDFFRVAMFVGFRFGAFGSGFQGLTGLAGRTGKGMQTARQYPIALVRSLSLHSWVILRVMSITTPTAPVSERVDADVQRITNKVSGNSLSSTTEIYIFYQYTPDRTQVRIGRGPPGTQCQHLPSGLRHNSN